jgi:hypothetical protein
VGKSKRKPATVASSRRLSALTGIAPDPVRDWCRSGIKIVHDVESWSRTGRGVASPPHGVWHDVERWREVYRDVVRGLISKQADRESIERAIAGLCRAISTHEEMCSALSAKMT